MKNRVHLFILAYFAQLLRFFKWKVYEKHIDHRSNLGRFVLKMPSWMQIPIAFERNSDFI